MNRHYFLPSFGEYEFFCFPHSVGLYTMPDDHNVTRPEGVRDYSLHFVKGGKGFLELNNTLYTLKSGDVFLHRPYDRMRYYTSEEEPWSVYWMQFNGIGLADYLLGRGFHDSSVWFIKEIDMLERAYLDLLNELEAHNFARPARISSLVYGVLAEFLSGAIPFSNKRITEKVNRIIQILPIMQSKAQLPFVLEEWADHVQLTPNYFCSLFKKVTRMTPLAYVTKCRIQLSKQWLLGHPDKSIKEIAIDSGYPSISYFNKIFLNSEGMTPGEFRKLHNS